jgi:putative toxin-antitoxin system antitoxin component (TIGR02293 family)
MAVYKKTSAITAKIPVKVKKVSGRIENSNSHAAIIYYEFDKPENQMTPFEKMEKLNQGLGKSDLEKLKTRTELDYDELSRVLSVTRSTLIRKKSIQKYSHAVAERMLDIADIYSYGYTVFEDENKFREWIFEPNQALGGKMPYDILDNQFGRQEVRNLIGRIEYGVYS